MARIYTRTGDRGETSLLGGRRTSKADERVDLYGGVDELNSWLGFAAAVAARRAGEAGAPPSALAARLPDLLGQLTTLQSRLFELGALLADPARCERPAADDDPFLAAARSLEAGIDALDADLAPLRSFLLPAGDEAVAALHVARSVCRRVERQAVGAAGRIAVPQPVLVFLNRLSDFLFVAARWTGAALGAPETPWRPDAAPTPEAEKRHE